ncbi:DUF4435 domain-containing protein [Burkholderia gladioli]|uniref:DUF4435 domain-containing protein n=1 Tax=Burkholderia gladioli TaxID=28095 RepID=UPI000BF0484D|nr:DUF4435 domain-containing protein [Burkholderia gladioli]PEH86354.1 hypothetical protein CRM95_16140 [Burkholderia gladioli]
MSDIDYSIDALNALDKFYRVDTIVYVEGDDDILFWDKIFRTCSTVRAEILPAHGASELDKYVDKLIQEDVDFVVARDGDYTNPTDIRIQHPRVIYTFGYSIENSLYVKSSLSRLERIWCRSLKINVTDCARWIEEFTESFKRLLILDIANALEGMGIPVLGDNCSRFMRSEKSALPDPKKISAFEETVAQRFKPSKIKKIEEKLRKNNLDLPALIRGHFLASGVLKYMASKAKAAGKSGAISQDTLYTMAIAEFERSFSDQHPHYQHYKSSLDNMQGALIR